MPPSTDESPFIAAGGMTALRRHAHPIHVSSIRTVTHDITHDHDCYVDIHFVFRTSSPPYFGEHDLHRDITLPNQPLLTPPSLPVLQLPPPDELVHPVIRTSSISRTSSAIRKHPSHIGHTPTSNMPAVSPRALRPMATDPVNNPVETPATNLLPKPWPRFESRSRGLPAELLTSPTTPAPTPSRTGSAADGDKFLSPLTSLQAATPPASALLPTSPTTPVCDSGSDSDAFEDVDPDTERDINPYNDNDELGTKLPDEVSETSPNIQHHDQQQQQQRRRRRPGDHRLSFEIDDTDDGLDAEREQLIRDHESWLLQPLRLRDLIEALPMGEGEMTSEMRSGQTAEEGRRVEAMMPTSLLAKVSLSKVTLRGLPNASMETTTKMDSVSNQEEHKEETVDDEEASTFDEMRGVMYLRRVNTSGVVSRLNDLSHRLSRKLSSRVPRS